MVTPSLAFFTRSAYFWSLNKKPRTWRGVIGVRLFCREIDSELLIFHLIDLILQVSQFFQNISVVLVW